MSPYRTSPESRGDKIVRDEPPRDDVILAIVLLLIAGTRLTIAIAQHEVFQVEATVSLFMVAMAVGMLVRMLLRRN